FTGAVLESPSGEHSSGFGLLGDGASEHGRGKVFFAAQFFPLAADEVEEERGAALERDVPHREKSEAVGGVGVQRAGCVEEKAAGEAADDERAGAHERVGGAE